MAKKKRKRSRVQEPESALARWTKRNSKWFRRLGIAGGLIAALVAVIVLADPFGGTPTAIDENGEVVRAGLIDGQPGARARAGSPAPNFLLPDYDQQAVRLADQQGKAVFVNFWATWCGPCEKEMPDIVRIAEENPDDVVVLAINRGESKGTAEGWTRSRNFPEDLPNFKWIIDPREEVTKKYQVDGMPQSFVVDRGGFIFREIRQASEYDEMNAIIQQIVGPSAAVE